jgi:hypothetical protein
MDFFPAMLLRVAPKVLENWQAMRGECQAKIMFAFCSPFC